ncbi:MAG TPA: HAD-IA family hydrolase [Bryobacteraceae bacterium]|nr:HAD-IA family hydrolase [Bryobacteraceae bacterium]
MAVNLIIFDLDGTLVDSKLDLAHSVNATRKHFGLDPLDNELVYSYVGNGVLTLMRKSLGSDFSDGQIQQALEYFLGYYREHMLDFTTLYPGVRESLDRLKDAGVRLSVLTNKPVRFSQDILAGLGVGGYFFRVYGGNSFEQKKPDPAGVHALLSEARVPAGEALIVGDSAVDVVTARNAGVPVCGVTYGFQPGGFREQPPDFTVDRMEQLAELVVSGRRPKGDVHES